MNDTTQNCVENALGALDCISRQSAILLANDLKQDLPDDERIADMVMARNEGILEYQTQLSLLPPVNPQEPIYYPPCEDCHNKMNEIRKAYDKVQSAEPKTGHWIEVHPLQENDEGDYMCSECKCGGLVWKPTTYCPNCGAKMEK